MGLGRLYGYLRGKGEAEKRGVGPHSRGEKCGLGLGAPIVSVEHQDRGAVLDAAITIYLLGQ